jgi:hypothetical protein
MSGYEYIALVTGIGGTFLGFAIAMWRAAKRSGEAMTETAAKVSKALGKMEGSVKTIGDKVDGVASAAETMRDAYTQRFMAMEKRQDIQERRLEASEKRLSRVEDELERKEDKRE